MEFSKKVLVVSWCITIALTIVACLLSVFALPVDNITTLAALSWGEVTAVNAFYFWKAKNENRYKLTKQMVKDWGEQYGADFIAQIISTLLPE